MTLRFTWKNMLSRPGRLMVLLLCITIASMAACFAFDAGRMVENVLRGYMTHFMGNVEYIITDENGLEDADFEGCPPCRCLYLQAGTKREARRDPKFYAYELSETVNVMGFYDLQEACEMGMFGEPLTLADDEIALSRPYSEAFGYAVGDAYELTDLKGDPIPLTVAAVFEPAGMSAISKYTAVCNASVTERQNGSDTKTIAAVDVLSEADSAAFREMMEQRFSKDAVQDMTLGEEEEEMLRTLNTVLYLSFILTFLLVVFVTVSFSEKILHERMSTIGTLRSIGISRRKTTFLLLLENALYGLTGGGIACVLYLLLRPVIMDMAMEVTAEEGLDIRQMIGNPSPLTFACVLGGAVLLECLVPLAEILRAVKTPIRDIIFANQDTQAQISPVRTAAGLVLLAAGGILGLFVHTIPAQLAEILLLVIGAALAVQAVVRGITRLLRNGFAALHLPVAEFAALEAGDKKSYMGNAVLAVTTITAAAAIFRIGTAMLYWTERPSVDTDVQVMELEHMKPEEYDFIADLDDVTEMAYFYESYDQICIGEKTIDGDVICLPDTDQVVGIRHLPETLGNDALYMDECLARRFSVQEGDTITITFRNDGVFPVEREMEVAGLCNSLAMTDNGAFLIGRELYLELYGDYPSEILLRCKSGTADALAERLRSVLTGGEEVRTAAEQESEARENSRYMRMMLVLMIALAMGLTLIGISGNQLIGFEARRRELALLHSTAMSRGKLIRLLVLESGISFGIAVVLSAALSVPVTHAIAMLFDHIDMGITISVQTAPGGILPFILVIWAVVMLTVAAPVYRLYRMDTANEIKYE